MPHGTIDVHYQNPEWPISLGLVGLSGLALSLPLALFKGHGECKESLAIFDVYTDLPEHMRGSNISRSVRAILEAAKSCKDPWDLLRELSEMVLKAHEYSSRALIYLRVPSADIDGSFTLKFGLSASKGRELLYIFGVSTLGITACPSALAVSLQRSNRKITHMQRAKLEVLVKSSRPVEYEGLPSIVQKAFSGNLKALLGREDESALIEKAFDNPLFTEDLVRKTLNDVSEHLKPLAPHGVCVSVRARSFESIHNFDIIASGEACW